ncbi:M28 family peptidase [Aminipila terrae]|uniref:M28 family peptidase n=1 Tax=Aminipila terrae TaxID=2697030 RepID=A0A6P1MD15_9FIRM|nr:M28 family peptidase [Aminipila terrae]QHI71797.1 M28 family peptidase [Aminipila terrae]
MNVKKKIALFLVTAMVLTAGIPAAYATDTVVTTPQVVTSEEGTTSGGAITTEAAIVSESAITSEGAVTSGSAVSENPANTGNDPTEKSGEEQKKLNQLLKAEAEAPKFDNSKDSVMYHHLAELSKNARVASTDQEKTARDYIKGIFEGLGYTTNVQSFNYTRKGVEGNSSNVIAVKPGKSDRQVIVGAHYDSVNASTGASDNASGVSVMLGAAEMLKDIDTDYTIKFIAFGAEEVGLKGSTYYTSQMSKEEISNTVAMINLDTVIFGDKKYVYGNLGEKGWVREQALDISKSLNLGVITQEGLNSDYPKGTTGDWSDHDPFDKLGIPWIYFESTNWDLKDKEGNWSTGEHETELFGEIMHTERDNLTFMDEKIPGRVEDRLYSYTTLLYNLLKEINPPAEVVESAMAVSTNLLSMTQEKTIDVSVDLGYTPDLKNLTWTFGGKPFDQWTVIECKGKDGEGDKKETNDPFITFAEEPKLDGDKVVAKIKFGLPFGTDNLSARPYPRRIYPQLLGIMTLL